MKFQKPVNFRPWTEQETAEKIESAKSDIQKYDIQLMMTDKILNQVRQRKKEIQYKIGNKTKYLNQLKKQLEEFKNPQP